MTELDQALARIDRLETAIADQDRTIEDLNRVVLEQWKRIDELARRALQLSDQMREIENRSDLARPADPPPPHW